MCHVTHTDVVKGTLDKFFDHYSSWNALRKHLCSMNKTKGDMKEVEQGRLSASEVA